MAALPVDRLLQQRSHIAIAQDFRTAAGRSFYAARTGAWSVSNWLGLLNPSDW